MRGRLHERLRAATAAAHAALERDLDWASRVATLSGYRDLLARLRGLHAVYEPAIGLALADEDFFGPRRRLAKLDADLARLGLAPGAVAALPIPAQVALSPRNALGALYVLEGSTLGGQAILRDVERRLGLGPGPGTLYYRGHGPATSAMWRALLARLDGLSGDPAAEDEVAAAGVTTFRATAAWLTPAPALETGPPQARGG